MSAAHRSLARLPLEIFENLIVLRNNNANATTHKMTMLSEGEEEEEEENDNNEKWENDGDNAAAAAAAAGHVHDAAMLLRQAICQKLKAIPPSKQMPHRRKSLRRAAAAAATGSAPASSSAGAAFASCNTGAVSTITNNATTLFESVQTVGPLLFMSKTALLRALDPLLTYAECSELIRRICLYCSPTPKSAMTLLYMTRDLDDARNFIQQQQQQQQPQGCNVVEQQPVQFLRHIPTGLSSLDHQLRGGVRVGTITEIVGTSATAKSQMAMQLCIMAGLHHHGLVDSNIHGGAVYVDSEKKLSLQRLEEMAMSASRKYVKQQRRRQQQHQPLVAPSQTTLSPLLPPRRYQADDDDDDDEEEASFRHCRDFLANVSVHTPTTMDELFATLALVEDDVHLRNEQAYEEALLGPHRQQQQQQQHASKAATATTATTATFPVRLLILDSIAAPARREFGSGSAPQRAAAVMQCAQTLKRLADELQLAVVVLNQVDHHNASSTSLQQQQHRAALGTAWHHCVSTRIQLSSLPPLQRLLPTTGDDSFGGGGSRNSAAGALLSSQQEQLARIPRMASVVKSNVTGPGRSFSFEVTSRGLVEMFPSSTSISSHHNNNYK